MCVPAIAAALPQVFSSEENAKTVKNFYARVGRRVCFRLVCRSRAVRPSGW